MPRISHPSAVPTGRSQGCPLFRSFGIADDLLGGSPRFADLPAPSGGLPEFPRASRLPDLPLVQLAELPRFVFPLARRRANFQVALKLRSLGVASVPISELPASLSLGGAVAGFPVVRVRIYGWSIMNPRLHPNFASSACAADESSRSTGPAFPAWLSLLSQSLRALRLQQAGCVLPEAIDPASQVRSELLSDCFQCHRLI